MTTLTPMRPPRINTAARWGVEYRAPGSKVWRLLGTAGSEDQARKWLLRFSGSGGYRLRRPSGVPR